MVGGSLKAEQASPCLCRVVKMMNTLSRVLFSVQIGDRLIVSKLQEAGTKRVLPG